MNINISKITIIKTLGVDKVSLTTDMPCPYIPESLITQPLCLDFETSHNFSEEYVARVFPGISTEIINGR